MPRSLWARSKCWRNRRWVSHVRHIGNLEWHVIVPRDWTAVLTFSLVVEVLETFEYKLVSQNRFFFFFVCFFSLEMLGDAQNARTADFQWGQGIVLFLPILPASRQCAASDEQRCQTWSQSEAWRCKRGKLLPWPVGPGRSTRVPPECRMAAQRLKESAPGVVCVWNSPLSSCSRRLFPRCLPPAFWAAWHLVWRAIDCQWSFLAHGLYYSDASDCAHRTGG